MIEEVALHLKFLPPEFLNGVVITLIAIGFVTAIVLVVFLLIGISEVYSRRERIFSKLINKPFLRLRVVLLNFLTNPKPILLNPITSEFISYRVKLLNFLVNPWQLPARFAFCTLDVCLTVGLVIGALSILPVILILLNRTGITTADRVTLVAGIAATGALIGFLVAPFVTLKYRKKGFVRAMGLYFGTIVAGSEVAMLTVFILVAMSSD